MANEKDKQEIDDLEKTMVMSLSTLSTEVEEKKQGVQKKKKAYAKTQAKDKAELIANEHSLAPKASMPIMGKIVEEQEVGKADDIEKVADVIDIEKDIKDVIETKDMKSNTKSNTQIDKQKNEETSESSNDRKADTNVHESENIKESLTKKEEHNQDSEKIEQEEAEKQTSKQEKITSDEEVDKKKEKMTLEEKRKIERSKLMTIEEKRALQKEGKLPDVQNEKKRFSDDMGKIDYALLILSILMSWFVTYRIYSYFSWGYALLFFFIAHVILTGIFFLSKKKRKIGMGINIGFSIIFLILSLVMVKLNDFTDQIFDNSESEMVMLVAKKDSPITEKDDFKDKKIAFIKSDGDTNTFAKEMLSEAKKEAYEENVYVTYKEAYEALMSKDIDMMIYTSFTKQRLAEDDIQSWEEVKVVMQKSRALKAVESKDVDISKDPFNIYISGVDLTSYSINEKGSSDVNIIMTVNPQTEKIIMQTIPRDTWAGLTCSNGEHTKLTYAGAYGGIDCSINTIEELIGIDINYYAKINFQGVIDLVDALGGITVNSDVSFCEAHAVEGYGVKNYCYNAGVNTLEGVDALMFSRIRKVFADGDVERGRHQMEVVNAVIRKFSESPSLGNINALLGAVENNFTTNLQEDDIGKGLELFLGMKDQLTNIETVTMEGELVWNTDEVTNEYLYYFIPDDGQVELVRQRIQDVIDGK